MVEYLAILTQDRFTNKSRNCYEEIVWIIHRKYG